MKNLLSISLLFCSTTLFFSCVDEGNSSKDKTAQKRIDYDAMAQELCICMTPLMDIQQKITALSAEGKTDEIQDLLSNIEKISENGDECVAMLEAKYGVVENENEAKANAAFQKACPKIASMLEDAVK